MQTFFVFNLIYCAVRRYYCMFFNELNHLIILKSKHQIA